ncbi:hypothetical protein GCM10023148_50960 [Actinokineospora soli]
MTDQHRAAWHGGDPDAAAAAVVTFADPDTDKPLHGHALAAHAADFMARFPGEFTFTGGGDVLTWTLTAAHRAPYLGIPATGAALTISGVDVVTRDDEGLHVRRHFDRVAVAEALGHQARFVPRQDGDQEFGTSSRTPGRPGTPGALTLTWLDVRDDDESADVDLLSHEVVKSLKATKGFLGVGTFDIAGRKYTLTAFDKPESVRSVHARPHQRAMRRFFKSGLCAGAYTSVWTLDRESHHARCPTCGETATQARACGCGWTPDPHPLF